MERETDRLRWRWNRGLELDEKRGWTDGRWNGMMGHSHTNAGRCDGWCGAVVRRG